MRAHQGTHNNLARSTFKPGTVVTCQKWSKFENDQLPGQTWSNLVKDGQKKMVKKEKYIFKAGTLRFSLKQL
jgi:hypothetical protein